MFKILVKMDWNHSDQFQILHAVIPCGAGGVIQSIHNHQLIEPFREHIQYYWFPISVEDSEQVVIIAINIGVHVFLLNMQRM